MRRSCRHSSNGKPIEVESVAVDVVACRHVLQSAGDGRIEAEPAAPVLLEQGKPPIEERWPIGGDVTPVVILDEPPVQLDLVGVPGRSGAHSGLAVRPEMGTLVGPPVVPRDYMRLEAAGRGNRIVGKCEA